MERKDLDREARLFFLEQLGLHRDLGAKVDAYYLDLIQEGTLKPVLDSDDTVALPIPGLGASVEANAEFALEQQSVMEFMFLDKKINAIKELRMISNMGLKEAKEAVELAASWHAAGRIPRKERARVDAETAEAIASIKAVMAARSLT